MRISCCRKYLTTSLRGTFWGQRPQRHFFNSDFLNSVIHLSPAGEHKAGQWARIWFWWNRPKKTCAGAVAQPRIQSASIQTINEKPTPWSIHKDPWSNYKDVLILKTCHSKKLQIHPLNESILSSHCVKQIPEHLSSEISLRNFFPSPSLLLQHYSWAIWYFLNCFIQAIRGAIILIFRQHT